MTDDIEAEMNFVTEYLLETVTVIGALDKPDNNDAINDIVDGLVTLRNNGGRLFILGVGGSAAHASHAVNDFRKICDIEAYAPTDNVAELTAHTNDAGWDVAFTAYLDGSRFSSKDAILVLSVGGGSVSPPISENIVNAVAYASKIGAAIYGIVGRDGGYTATKATVCVVIPPMYNERITPHTEGIAAIVWHLLVSHPKLKVVETKWETHNGDK